MLQQGMRASDRNKTGKNPILLKVHWLTHLRLQITSTICCPNFIPKNLIDDRKLLSWTYLQNYNNADLGFALSVGVKWKKKK
jgi:hypothetical protein